MGKKRGQSYLFVINVFALETTKCEITLDVSHKVSPPWNNLLVVVLYFRVKWSISFLRLH